MKIPRKSVLKVHFRQWCTLSTLLCSLTQGQQPKESLFRFETANPVHAQESNVVLRFKLSSMTILNCTDRH
jgi:hypothetical protein